jgi:hypothetical protein
MVLSNETQGVGGRDHSEERHRDSEVATLFSCGTGV